MLEIETFIGVIVGLILQVILLVLLVKTYDAIPFHDIATVVKTLKLINFQLVAQQLSSLASIDLTPLQMINYTQLNNVTATLQQVDWIGLNQTIQALKEIVVW